MQFKSGNSDDEPESGGKDWTMNIECQKVTKEMKGKGSPYNVPAETEDNMVNFKVQTVKFSSLIID